MAAHVVNEGEVDVALPHGGAGHVGQDQVLVQDVVAVRHHARQHRGHSRPDLGLAVHAPALNTETVAAVCNGWMQLEIK